GAYVKTSRLVGCRQPAATSRRVLELDRGAQAVEGDLVLSLDDAAGDAAKLEHARQGARERLPHVHAEAERGSQTLERGPGGGVRSGSGDPELESRRNRGARGGIDIATQSPREEIAFRQ